MLNTAMNDILFERAAFARDVEYMRNNIEDSIVQESVLACESVMGEYTVEATDEELDAAIKQASKDDSTENDEVERILRSDKDLTLDEIIGIEDETENL